ncbi:MAG: lamin tail domain-containing protein, partial [Chloroflexota bacterium]
EPVDLGGWSIEISNEDGAGLQIPKDTLLQPEEYLVVYLNQPELAETDKVEIRLLNKTGQLVDSVSLPDLPADASYSLDIAGVWHADWPPTPGEPNSPLAPEPQPAPKQIPARPF